MTFHPGGDAELKFGVVEDADPTIDVTGVVVMRRIEATATVKVVGNTCRHGSARR